MGPQSKRLRSCFICVCIDRYFFYVLLALTVLGILDGMVFLPVLLSLVGPPAEVVSRNHPDRLPTPSPPPSPQATHSHSHSASSRRSSSRTSSNNIRSSRRSVGAGGVGSTLYPRLHGGSNLSLTTITEEPPSSTRSSQSLRSSHEIVVEPQVVVETTTTPASNGTGDSHLDHHVTTKVTATAKVKLELHTPLPGTVEPTYRSSSSSSSTSTSSNSNRRSNRRSSSNHNVYGGSGHNAQSPRSSYSSPSSSPSSGGSVYSQTSRGSSDLEMEESISK
ncbi:hypothetical protein SK128_020293 [Halocaridina rubra]|uniref:Uncharacterized protein n=1 Tax=Halocaridina rubra TaxID=373956 RepID=A0AAN8XDB7_HALRR